eukprot:721198_1
MRTTDSDSSARRSQNDNSSKRQLDAQIKHENADTIELYNYYKGNDHQPEHNMANDFEAKKLFPDSKYQLIIITSFENHLNQKTRDLIIKTPHIQEWTTPLDKALSSLILIVNALSSWRFCPDALSANLGLSLFWI